jgi:hypothetical protein
MHAKHPHACNPCFTSYVLVANVKPAGTAVHKSNAAAKHIQSWQQLTAAAAAE